MFRREFVDLWTGGRVLLLLVLFALVMSVTSVLHEIESRLDPIPPTEMVFLTVLNAVSFGVVIGLVIGADSISGERERGTLEPLLLTPVRARQIVVGKFLAAVSPWPVALVVSVPYLVVLSRGSESLVPAVALGAVLGSLLTVTFTGFAMLVSIWSPSNRVSLFVCLAVYLIFLIPTQFPTNVQKGDLGYLVQELNPLQATSEFLEKVLVSQRAVADRLPYLTAVLVCALLILGLLLVYAAPRLRVDGQASSFSRHAGEHSATVVVLVAAVLVGLSWLSTPKAVAATPASNSTHPPLEISVDLAYATVSVGDAIRFTTQVTNQGAVESAPLTMAMNIVLTGKGEPVDPEDWSPQRTQAVAPLSPGGSSQQDWSVNAILEGSYMVYVTVIPEPSGPGVTTQPVASPAVHLTVNGFTNTNPGGILPVAVLTPVLLILIALIPKWRRRHSPDQLPAEEIGPGQ
ncbi:MAG: ABC transporter permease subunit [Actinomycetes bacterium]